MLFSPPIGFFQRVYPPTSRMSISWNWSWVKFVLPILEDIHKYYPIQLAIRDIFLCGFALKNVNPMFQNVSNNNRPGLEEGEIARFVKNP